MKKTEDFYCENVFSGKIQVERVKETKNILAFHHTKSTYELHIVIVPKQHITKLSDVTEMDLVCEIFKIAKEIIIEKKLDETNYRIITNGGKYQDSKHLHFHLVSEKAL